MFFELCIICFIISALRIIRKLLILFDIVHIPKKRVHIRCHVKRVQVSFSTTEVYPDRAAIYQIKRMYVYVTVTFTQACYCSFCEILLTPFRARFMFTNLVDEDGASLVKNNELLFMRMFASGRVASRKMFCDVRSGNQKVSVSR